MDGHDNDLNDKHPLADLLNDYAKRWFLCLRDLVYIRNTRHALIVP